MQAVRMDKAVDAADWITDEDDIKLDLNSLPNLPGYHLLVLPVAVKQKTKGGIILPDKVKDDVAYLTTVAKVLKKGDLAYNDKDKFPNGAWCKEGDFVLVRTYSGTRFKIFGKEFRLINDDQVDAVVQDPRGLTRARKEEYG